MNKIEKVIYKSILSKVNNGDAVSFDARMYWVKLHLNKTY